MLRAHRTHTAFACLAVACALGLPLAACTSPERVARAYHEMVRTSDEQAIRDGIDEELGRMSAPDADRLAEIASTLDPVALESLATYGSTPEELCAHLLARLDYTVDDIEVEGDDATVTLTVRNVDLAAALAAANASLVSGEGAGRLEESYAQGTEIAIMRTAMDVIYAEIDATDALCETELTCRLQKQDNVWSLDEESSDALLEAALGGLAVEQ